VTLVSLLAVSSARARAAATSEPPVMASLAVTGSPDCAGRAEVVKLVARRSARIRFDDGAAGPALRVAIDAATPRALAATLSIVWPDGSRSERHLSAPTCAEIADAVALVVVLALDPAAAARQPPAAPPARPASPPRNEPAPPASPTRDRPPPEPPAEKSAPPPPAPRADDTPPPPPPPPEPVPPPPAPVVVQSTVAPPPAEPPSPPPVHRLDVGAAFRVASGPAPSLMPGVALVAGWERDTASAFALKVQLVAAHHARGGWSSADGGADFALDVATVHVCPLRVGPVVARARLCASGTAGRIAVEATGVLVPRPQSRPFAGVGAAALVSVSPHPRVEIAATVEPQVALIRDQFAFQSNVFYDVPPIVVFFGLGAAVTFP